MGCEVTRPVSPVRRERRAIGEQLGEPYSVRQLLEDVEALGLSAPAYRTLRGVDRGDHAPPLPLLGAVRRVGMFVREHGYRPSQPPTQEGPPSPSPARIGTGSRVT